MSLILDLLGVLMVLALPFLLGGAVYLPLRLLWGCWVKRREEKLAAERAAQHKAYTEDMFRQIRYLD